MVGAPQWRLLVDGALPGAVNMARDAAILEAVAGGDAPPTLRLYGWQPPCLSLGRHQGLEAADLGFCRAHGIDVVRRPTGGRALLHHHELTYAVAAPLGVGPIPHKLQDAYRRICTCLVRWCHELGTDAGLTPGEINLSLPSPRSTVPCFEVPAGGEVVVGGRKLIGSAARTHGGAILQHGAILLDWDSELQAGAMGLGDDSSLRPLVTTIRDELGRSPRRTILERALIEAFATGLGITLQPGALSSGEADQEEDLVPTFGVGG